MNIGEIGMAKMLTGGVGEADRARAGRVAAVRDELGLSKAAAGADRGTAEDEDVCRSGCREAKTGGGCEIVPVACQSSGYLKVAQDRHKTYAET